MDPLPELWIPSLWRKERDDEAEDSWWDEAYVTYEDWWEDDHCNYYEPEEADDEAAKEAQKAENCRRPRDGSPTHLV